MVKCPYCGGQVSPEHVTYRTCGGAGRQASTDELPGVDLQAEPSTQPSHPAGSRAAILAERYSPIYSLAGTLEGGATTIAVFAGLAALVSAGAAFSSEHGRMLGPWLAVAVMAGLTGMMGSFTLRLGAALLRVAADVAVGLAPGLTDGERASLLR